MMSNRLKVARYFDEDLYDGVVESIEDDKHNIICDDGDREQSVAQRRLRNSATTPPKTVTLRER